LGQNVELYNRKLLNIKLDTIKNLDIICKKFGLKFIYRPHPGDPREFLQRKLPNINFSSKNETLKDSFQKGDIFISFNSTSLVEAALHGKLCTQLKNYPVPTDDFENLGVCPKSFSTIEELKEFLKDVSKTRNLKKFYKPVSSKYIEVPKPDPGTRFLKLLDGMSLR